MVTAVLAAALVSSSGESVTFDFASERYLLAGQRGGSLAFLTRGLERVRPAPVVVLLHGLNPKGALHPWFNGDPGDLRKDVQALVATEQVMPFIFAAPTQSKDATVPRRMWPGFDLDAFVESTAKALEGHAVVDRSRVLVIGHSGGGCNPTGGIVAAASHARVAPMGVLAVDTCLDPDIADGLLLARPDTRVWVTWQRSSWPRPFDTFRAALEGPAPAKGPIVRTCEERPPLPPSPHNAILPETLRRALPSFLSPKAGLK